MNSLMVNYGSKRNVSIEFSLHIFDVNFIKLAGKTVLAPKMQKK